MLEFKIEAFSYKGVFFLFLWLHRKHALKSRRIHFLWNKIIISATVSSRRRPRTGKINGPQDWLVSRQCDSFSAARSQWFITLPICKHNQVTQVHEGSIKEKDDMSLCYTYLKTKLCMTGQTRLYVTNKNINSTLIQFSHALSLSLSLSY